MTIKYDLTGFYNLREGGGLKAGSDRLRTERLLRSDFPSSLDGEDQLFFSELPLSAVVDLRSEMERLSSPHFFKENGFRVINRGIEAGSAASMMSGHMTIEKMYLEMLQHSPKHLTDAVIDVADTIGEGAVLVHCTAGKDRTGIVIALIQWLLGVDEDAIVESYSLTEQNLDGPWLQRKIKEIPKALAKIPGAEHFEVDTLIPLMTSSPPAAMELVLKTIREGYGGPADFLVANGAKESDFEKLGDALLVP